jgi:hypothetical protein
MLSESLMKMFYKMWAYFYFDDSLISKMGPRYIFLFIKVMVSCSVDAKHTHAR